MERGNLGLPNATRYLGESRDPRALTPLLDALQRGGVYIRASAALALGYLGDSAAIPSLTERFMHDPDMYVRCDAALALGDLAAQAQVPILAARFAEENFEVRKRILMALARIGTVEARHALASIGRELEEAKPPPRGKDFLIVLIMRGLGEAEQK